MPTTTITICIAPFLSTLSLRRATKLRYPSRPGKINFYPRSPCGERLGRSQSRWQPDGFLSTLSLRRATRERQPIGVLYHHFYPRSPCGERPVTRVARTPTTVISIHALLAESDQTQSLKIPAHRISIHALLAESDDNKTTQQAGWRQFLSTLSLRRATDSAASRPRNNQISIHALLAESDLNSAYGALDGASISIHALLAESDPIFCKINTRRSIFLSTLSLRRATKRLCGCALLD